MRIDQTRRRRARSSTPTRSSATWTARRGRAPGGRLGTAPACTSFASG